MMTAVSGGLAWVLGSQSLARVPWEKPGWDGEWQELDSWEGTPRRTQLDAMPEGIYWGKEHLVPEKLTLHVLLHS